MSVGRSSTFMFLFCSRIDGRTHPLQRIVKTIGLCIVGFFLGPLVE